METGDNNLLSAGTLSMAQHELQCKQLERIAPHIQKCPSISEGGSPQIILLESLANKQNSCAMSRDNKWALNTNSVLSPNFEKASTDAECTLSVSK